MEESKLTAPRMISPQIKRRAAEIIIEQGELQNQFGPEAVFSTMLQDNNRLCNDPKKSPAPIQRFDHRTPVTGS